MSNKYIRTAIALSIFTIVYNLAEGIVSIYFGISDEAISLTGFGGDSLIEVASAGLVMWRFHGETVSTPHPPSRERAATLGIAVLFGLLSIVTAIAAAARLFSGRGPDTTLPGVVISLLSLSFMFFLWRAKERVAIQLNSATMKSDARCSLACIKLSTILLVGSGLVMLVPSFWWADSLAALILALFIGKEGWEMGRTARHGDFSGTCC